MLSTTTGLTAFKSDGAARSIRPPLRTCLPASALALACLTIAAPASARSPYDGAWSVVVMTRSGACDPTFRYGLQIENGRVLNAGGAQANVAGRVAPNGAINVTVQSGDQWASGAGRLSMARGGGVWRGQGSRGVCRGTWAAQRTSGPAVAAEETGHPIYNYAPGVPPAAMAEAGGPGNAAAFCAARFRSYDPASGTFLGFDGMRHPCP